MKNSKKVRAIILLLILPLIAIVCYLLYRFNYIPHKKYVDSDFGIETYISGKDTDFDGTDDQKDILEGAKNYISTKPKYKSKYYASGYPDDEYGVCTDVVAQACLNAGFDLMELVNEDVLSNPSYYGIEEPDINIDFRRVVNLNQYFSRKAVSLTTDASEISQWQAGDIVVWNHHIGIVSDHRNKHGVPFVIHHASPIQADYEEDILETWGTIIGHYRIS